MKALEKYKWNGEDVHGTIGSEFSVLLRENLEFHELLNVIKLSLRLGVKG